MRSVFELGKEIYKVKRELGFTVAKEEYTKAADLKNRLRDLQTKRDRYDAMYETARYEHMIALNRPSTADYLRLL
jgi:centrosomal protein CEP104